MDKNQSIIKNRDFEPEFSFRFSRSGGKGGQNVNKVNTKAELRFSIPNSALLTDKEKEILLQKLSTKINQNGELIIVSQAKRTQAQNRQVSIAKFYNLLAKVLKPKKKRKPIKPSPAMVQKRIDEKKQQSEKKERRKKIG